MAPAHGVLHYPAMRARESKPPAARRPGGKRPANKVMAPREWLLLLALAVLWGGSFFFIKLSLLGGFHPLTIVFGRVAIAAVELNLAVLASGRRMPGDARAWGAFTLMGLINNLVPFCLLVWAQSHIASGLASILNATAPLFTVLVAWLLTKDEHLTWGRIIGVLVGFLGVAMMIGLDALRLAGGEVLAEMAVLGAALCYAFAGIYGRCFARFPALVAAAGQLTTTAIMAAPVALVIERPWSAEPSLEGWGALLCLGLVSTGLAYVLYFRILATAGAVNLLLVTLLSPVNAVLLGTLLLGERLAGSAFLGMALIALGLAAIDGRPWAALRGGFNPRRGRAPG
jgi:drug/metabolite transporter (DMT)-like permease